PFFTYRVHNARPLLFVLRLPSLSSLCPYTTLFRSLFALISAWLTPRGPITTLQALVSIGAALGVGLLAGRLLATRWSVIVAPAVDRKSTRLNSSHVKISYAVFCLKKKRNF